MTDPEQHSQGGPRKQPEDLTPMPRGWRLAGILALLAAAGIGLGIWQASSMRRLREAPAATVAVLRFENPDGEPALDPVCEETARLVQQKLAAMRGLRVLPWDETRSLRGDDPDSERAAAGRGASVILSGSVRSRGRALRIGMRLISLRRGTPVWSQTYETGPDSLAGVASEAAREIAATLLGQRGTAPPARP